MVSPPKYDRITNCHVVNSIEMHKESIAEYEWPNGTYWKGVRDAKANGKV